MSDIVDLAIAAHGGLARFNELHSVEVTWITGGQLWDWKQQSEFNGPAHCVIDLHQQKHAHSPFLKAGQRSSYTPNRVAIDGQVSEERVNPRAAFEGHQLDTPWDSLHLAYFAGYAMWNYLTLPFSLKSLGVDYSEIDSYTENGETWRAIKVNWSKSSVTTHCDEMILYFGPDALLRRLDYDVDVNPGARGFHYMSDYKNFDGIMVPTNRRVYLPGSDNKPLLEGPIVVAIENLTANFT